MHIIERFGDAWASAEVLPTLDGTQDLGAGPVRSPLVAVPGGAYDAAGADRVRRQAERIVVRGTWVAASAAALEAKIAALRALVGLRSKLWRSNGAAQHWRYARLLQVEAPVQAALGRWAEARLDFEALPGPWQGTAHDLTVPMDGLPKTINMANGGNAPVSNVILTLTAGAVAITSVGIGMTGKSYFRWTGSLGAGKALVIDCGARSVRLAGVNAYAGFALGASHTIDDWLRLEPGSNPVIVGLSGGGSLADATLRYQYADGHA